MSFTLSSVLSGSFIGSQGTQGTQGLQGTQGTQGLQGLQGLQGIQNEVQGTFGTKGSQGTTGSSGSSTIVSQISKTTAYTLSSTDSGKHVSTNSDVTVPANTLSVGSAVTIYNNSSGTITIIEGSGVDLYKSGTTNTGNRLLSQRGLCTILCVASNTFVISGIILT